MDEKKTVKIAIQARHSWKTTAGFRGMMAWAALMDLLSAVPWIGLIFSGIGYGSLWLWMKSRGLNPDLFTGDTKKLVSTAAEFIGGAVGLGIIPGITLWTFFSIAEHKQKLAKKSEDEVEAMKQTQEKLAKQAEKKQGQIKKANQRTQRSKTSAYF